MLRDKGYNGKDEQMRRWGNKTVRAATEWKQRERRIDVIEKYLKSLRVENWKETV